MFNFNDEIEESTQALPEEDPVIREYLERQSSSVGNWETARNTYRRPSTFAATGTKEELLELEINIRDLIAEGVHGYSAIERMLNQMGYNYNKIREVFRRVTGIDPEVYVSPSLTYPVPPPGSIPMVNYGWGFAKGKEFFAIFIMPFDNGYAVFGQKDDVTREVLRTFPILSDARTFAETKVKELYCYDKVVDSKKTKPVCREDFVLPVEIIQHASAGFKNLYEYFANIHQTSSKSELRSIASIQLEQGIITGEEFKKISDDFGLYREADTSALVEQESELEIKELEDSAEDLFESGDISNLLRQTPDEFLEEHRISKNSFPDLSQLVGDFTESVNSSLESYTINVIGLHYVDVSGKLVKPADVATTEKVNLSFVISINRKDMPGKTKLGVISLVPVNDTFNFPTVFKAEDKKIYKFCDCDIDKIFADEIENMIAD